MVPHRATRWLEPETRGDGAPVAKSGLAEYKEWYRHAFGKRTPRGEHSLMRLHLCGVRGSTPAVGHEFDAVGGHTSCVAIAHDEARAPTLVLDAGTGLRRLSVLLDGQPFRGTILLGHLHWDHTQGLPFFTAGDRPDAEVRLLLPSQGGDALELLARGMGPPHFPISPDQLRGSWSFNTIDEGVHHLEGFDVLAREIPHPGGRAFGYRVSDGHSTMAYLSDHGPIVLGSGPDGWGPYHEAALALADGVDVLLHDAQYTADELPARALFGHSAADYAVRLGELAGAKHVALFHHDPGRTDGEVGALVERLQGRSAISVTAAVEGTTLRL
jgi:phosphoribosyl 1,2-cyclic phosphodiesterase